MICWLKIFSLASSFFFKITLFAAVGLYLLSIKTMGAAAMALSLILVQGEVGSSSPFTSSMPAVGN